MRPCSRVEVISSIYFIFEETFLHFISSSPDYHFSRLFRARLWHFFRLSWNFALMISRCRCKYWSTRLIFAPISSDAADYRGFRFSSIFFCLISRGITSLVVCSRCWYFSRFLSRGLFFFFISDFRFLLLEIFRSHFFLIAFVSLLISFHFAFSHFFCRGFLLFSRFSIFDWWCADYFEIFSFASLIFVSLDYWFFW